MERMQATARSLKQGSDQSVGHEHHPKDHRQDDGERRDCLEARRFEKPMRASGRTPKREQRPHPTGNKRQPEYSRQHTWPFQFATA